MKNTWQKSIEVTKQTKQTNSKFHATMVEIYPIIEMEMFKAKMKCSTRKVGGEVVFNGRLLGDHPIINSPVGTLPSSSP